MAASEETRPQDARTFSIDPATLPFERMDLTLAETDRWWGTLNGSGYRIEVPRNWNGRLVMYAHGYEGPDNHLEVSDIPIRRHLIENGYAWAASSFSKNGYDVRAGIEDTNALALAFTRIAQQNGRTLAAPSRVYILGASMGGHVAAAAVEQETLATSRNKLRYDGAVPICGVVGDTALFDYLNAYQMVAQYLAGIPATSFPTTDFAAIQDKVQNALFINFPALPNAQGKKLEAALLNLTGGERPIFADSFRLKPFQDAVWQRFGNDGTIEGILTKNVTDTTGFVYQLDNDPALSAEETTLNSTILRVRAEPDANRLRRDGMRWIPKVNGQFNVPVVTLHTLGDLAVPISMEQIYRRRAIANGSDSFLVQRMIRGPGHCDFTRAEVESAFDAMVAWEQGGPKPEGDDVLTPSVISRADYGCRFTDARFGLDDPPALLAVRELMPACPGQ